MIKTSYAIKHVCGQFPAFENCLILSLDCPLGKSKFNLCVNFKKLALIAHLMVASLPV